MRPRSARRIGSFVRSAATLTPVRQESQWRSRHPDRAIFSGLESWQYRGMYRLFISHSWTYSDAYDRLIDLLNAAPNFAYMNYSVPKDDPIHNAPNTMALRAAIQRQMNPAQVIVVLAGVYATHSKWINEEVALAKQNLLFPKPLLAIEPWGSERTSSVVKDNADRIVKWNTSSIVTAIRELARG